MPYINQYDWPVLVGECSAVFGLVLALFSAEISGSRFSICGILGGERVL
ncbi:MAG TPA: hypothetical protein PLV89_12375 [Treponemataceae bacterium]|nr:hypothetical protein [Treponemataceae bacterium]